MTKIPNTNFAEIDKDLQKSYYNKNLIYNTTEIWPQKYEQYCSSIESQLAMLRINPHAPICNAYNLTTSNTRQYHGGNKELP